MTERIRSVDERIGMAHKVIDRSRFMGAQAVEALFSGGHDSLCAVHVTSQHPKFDGKVHHINTGIGAKYTGTFVESVCDKFGWRLHVHKSPSTFEKFVRERGFPGPAMHARAYSRLKDRCVRQICKGKMPRALITGCRSQESTRRMGYVEPVKVGERSPTTGILREPKRIWTAPCHDWSKAEQMDYMDEFGLPVNKLKVALGMSGECFCGAFAKPFELDAIREHAPDVAEEIDRLTVIAEECGKPCVWGQRPSGERSPAPGPLCHSCGKT